MAEMQLGREISNNMEDLYAGFNETDQLDEKSMALMFLSGDGGDTDIYKENLAELGLFQNIDPSRVFDIKDAEKFEGNFDNLDEQTKLEFMMRGV